MSTSSAYYDQVQGAAERIRSTSKTIPDTAVVLGSGLGAFASSLDHATSIPYGDIPNWPMSSVVGHEGRLVIGECAGRSIAALSGRAHFYEGHDLKTVTFATRVLGVLGVKTLILTNAAGGINKGFVPGDLMVIDDHINLLGSSPLVGPNDERFGVRFPDLTHVYSARLRRIADDTAAAQGTALRHGVYAACHGPSYENPSMPGYAWPSYAAYPNYAALSYPQQYSPTAWPYIGPFYPYPQVPLAWCKVSLEWDDGWWFLDFSAHNSSH